MNKIDYQALREAAERAIPAMERLLMLPVDDDLLSEQELKDYGVDIDALNAFKFLTGPETVLALLDERERNQQYIKRRDQENEEIALTVGKLSVELEASENNLIDSECHVAELEEALRDKQALLEASEKRIAELRDWNAGLAQESLTYQQRVAELEVIKSAAEKLVRCKGRYHSEQNYRALAALFGVTVPDLPPLEAESVSQTYKLNELSGNSPVSPGGWISCSERMPDTKTAVLVAKEFDRKGDWRMKWATYIPGHPDANDGWIIPGASWKPSHWMPLPEPPQEMK
ncbi:ead/Ea22-like family protein [Escherichia coli]|uniref:ead/Ea22-like family protein n=1 Tax=Escherichia coli TaxID=562 RepID=UPI003904CA42